MNFINNQIKKYQIYIKNRPKNFAIKVGKKNIADGEFFIIAGPCAIENRNQFFSIAKSLKNSGINIVRGGIFKPRTSPYDFQGVGIGGLGILKEAKKKFGFLIASEVMSVEHFRLLEKFIDIFQVGARNMYNYPLLSVLGRQRKPVILKRGMSATIKEFLSSAEYIAFNGNNKIILCERGIRTFDDFTRNTLDLAIVPALKKITYLPIIVDPSHGTGRKDLIEPMALAAVAAGANGIMVEVHNNPGKAFSDGQQSLSLNEFKKLASKISKFVDFFREIK
ncbi:MAG: 3-deoxy-7-phosphoheptulonate synthase [Candidatus Pacebacteria bacterium]|nr:3-deoxy-7-phosphoheptulonate synthase [Candidatus Paceibacterota bacterium]